MKRTYDGFTLKMIAIIAMTINHIGVGLNFYNKNFVFYIFSLVIGKLTFPIMAYLLVKGFNYTRNKIKYAIRLGMFWLLSIYPFYYLFSSNLKFNILQQVTNNVLFTLLVGLVMMICLEKVQSKIVRFWIVVFFTMITIASDWPVLGILMIYGFYSIKDKKKKVIIPVSAISMISMVGIIVSGIMAVNANVISSRFLWVIILEGASFLGMFATVPLLLNYNEEKGYSPFWIKWGFYAYYPLHLLILGVFK